jgi:hypothetical protein
VGEEHHQPKNNTKEHYQLASPLKITTLTMLFLGALSFEFCFEL